MNLFFTVKKIEAPPDNRIWFKIEASIDNKPVAFLDCTEPNQQYGRAVIQRFEVNEGYRGRGVGFGLINHLKEICSSKHNSCPIEVYFAPLDSYVRLEDLEAFYRKRGAAIRLCRVSDNCKDDNCFC